MLLNGVGTNAGKMFWIIYLNFLFSKLIVCNNEPVKTEICQYGPMIKKEKVFPIPAFSVQYLDYAQVNLPEPIHNYIKNKKHVILCYIVLRNGFYLDTAVKFFKNFEDIPIKTI